MKAGNRDAKCPICLIPYLEKISLGALTGCGHVFCSDCLEDYKTKGKSQTCPVCRDLPSQVLFKPAIQVLRFS